VCLVLSGGVIVVPPGWTPEQRAQLAAKEERRRIEDQQKWEAMTDEQRQKLDAGLALHKADVARHAAAMHSREAIEAFLEDLRRVCEVHDVVLIGTDGSESIFGEISIGRLSNAESISWAIDHPYELHKGNWDFANWEIIGYFPRLPDKKV
jgi:hypothetical protein